MTTDLFPVGDDFWAETPTATLLELLDSVHVVPPPRPRLFVSTIRAELTRRGLHPTTEETR